MQRQPPAPTSTKNAPTAAWPSATSTTTAPSTSSSPPSTLPQFCSTPALPTQTITGSSSTYASQSALRLHFGLGPTTQIEKLEILWPSGQKSTHQNIAADKLQTLHQPPATSRPAEQP